MFRTREMRTGVGAFFTPGRRCPPDRHSLAARRLPLLNGQPFTPLEQPTGGAADNGAYEDSLAFTRPAFPSPVVPGWNGNASASSPGFAPRGYPRRTPGREWSNGHWTRSRPHQRPPNGVITHRVRPHVARLPPASPACCDRPAAKVSRRCPEQRRLVAHERILPVDPPVHRVGGLSVRQILHEPQHRDQREGRQEEAQPAPARVQLRERAVLVSCA